VDREALVLSRLGAVGFPVAHVYGLCTDDAVIGTWFFVMEMVEGRIFWDATFPGVAREDRPRYLDAMNATLAQLHSFDPEAIGLGEYGKPGNYFARQLGRWSEQFGASRTREIPAMDALIRELPARCPADDGVVALVHGDYRIDNLMFAPEGARIAAVVDWELSTLGHPLADLGYFCMALRLPRNPALPGLAGIEREALGIPSEAELLSQYAALTGRAIPADWAFVLAFSYFRLAAIAQGVAKRAEQGNASSEQAMQAGAMTELLAQAGLRVLEKG
jgi:aminoglycoside phosphotransferase (APT) family kinase protein